LGERKKRNKNIVRVSHEAE